MDLANGQANPCHDCCRDSTMPAAVRAVQASLHRGIRAYDGGQAECPRYVEEVGSRTATLARSLVAAFEVAGCTRHELLRAGVIGEGDAGRKPIRRPSTQEGDRRLVVADDDGAIGAGEPAERLVGEWVGRGHDGTIAPRGTIGRDEGRSPAPRG